VRNPSPCLIGQFMYACLIHLKCCCFDPFMTRLKSPALQVQPRSSDFSTCVCHECVRECLSSLIHSMQTRSLSLHCLQTRSLSLNAFTFTERVHFHCIVCKRVRTCSLVLHHRELTASLSSYLSISHVIDLFLAFNTPLSPGNPYIYMHHCDSFGTLGIQLSTTMRPSSYSIYTHDTTTDPPPALRAPH
jgi:hypothetical protein